MARYDSSPFAILAECLARLYRGGKQAGVIYAGESEEIIGRLVAEVV